MLDVVVLVHANRPSGGIRRERRARSARGYKAAAASVAADYPCVCVCVCVIGSSQGETSARTHTHTLIARNGRPAAFVIECVTLSMMVLKKARPSRTPVALCISNRVW